MNEEKKLTKFKQLMFKAYKDSDGYNKIAYQMLKAREILVRENYLFNLHSAQSQHNLCSLIVLMSTHTSTEQMRKFKIFTKNTTISDLSYLLINGYKDPEILELKEPIKLLKYNGITE